MLDVMLDLETMGNGPNAAIIAIGAVDFDPACGFIGTNFYETVDLDSAIKSGGVVDASTVIWWMGQEEEARAEFQRPGVHIAQVLHNFRAYLQGCGPLDEVRIWGNGATFDNVILGSAYTNMGSNIPWKYSNNRCYRTVKNLRPEVTIPSSGTKHNALDDAIWQARHLCTIWRTL